MQLDFRHRHLSIVAFPPIELPPLTIILGLNGSGKTHLLEAIANGAVSNSIAGVSIFPAPPSGAPTSDIRLLSNQSAGAPITERSAPITQTLYPPPVYTPPVHQNLQQTRAVPFEYARQGVLAQFSPRLEAALGGPISDVTAGQDPWRLGQEEMIRRAGTGIDAAEVRNIFEAAALAMMNPYDASVPEPNRQMFASELVPVKAVAAKLGVPVLAVTEQEVDALRPWSTDQFQADLSTLFGRYRDTLLKNELARLQDAANGTTAALSQNRFLEIYGPPPWEEVSNLFRAFRLPYVAQVPPLLEYSQVTFNLLRRDTGDAVAPAHLSAGEKILLQFAISSIKYDDELTRITRPKLLLLDEMDAPLHPEMVHHWLAAVQSGIVGEQGINCILTTHSPTTVALAPEEALFEMRDGRSGLRKISKQDALNRLTFGVPTLSIDYSGRRQVFTESDTDAAIYERAYSLIKGHIDCDRQLNFLSTGMRNKDGGEINSGCTVVTNIVQRLNDTGNMSVFGIVDWDGEAVSTDRVRVVAEGTHDGIENLLLDPLLICLLLLKGRRPPHGLADIERFAGADKLETANLRRLVDAIQNKVLPGNTGETVTVTYLGGATANVLRDYATMDDHALEDSLRAEFPYLRKWSNRGALVMAVVEEVLTEHRGFCPTPLKTLFESVANA